VFHELVSPTIHLDVHVVPPTDEFDFYRLVTSGMAEVPMTVPDGFPHPPYAEVTIALPRHWKMHTEAFGDERVHWPVRLLKDLGRLPTTTRRFSGGGTRSRTAIHRSRTPTAPACAAR
jgi:hypothetical protein